MVIVSETSKKFPYGPYMIQLRLNLRRNDSIFTLTEVKIGIYGTEYLSSGIETCGEFGIFLENGWRKWYFLTKVPQWRFWYFSKKSNLGGENGQKSRWRKRYYFTRWRKWDLPKTLTIRSFVEVYFIDRELIHMIFDHQRSRLSQIINNNSSIFGSCGYL